MYKLETENFSLELLPGICQDSFPYPKANSLRVKRRIVFGLKCQA